MTPMTQTPQAVHGAYGTHGNDRSVFGALSRDYWSSDGVDFCDLHHIFPKSNEAHQNGRGEPRPRAKRNGEARGWRAEAAQRTR